jgi:hypothetical protein
VLYQRKNSWQWVLASSIEPKRAGKSGRYFKVLVRLGIWVVIRDVRAAVSFGDVQIDKQLRDGFGAHAGAAIGVQGERVGHDILFIDRIGNQLLGEFRRFPVCDHPTDNVAAENIEDHVQVTMPHAA